MPTPYIDGWVSAELICSLAGQVVETVFQYRASPVLTNETDALAFANLFRTTLTSQFQNACTNELTLDRVHVKSHNLTFPNVEAISLFPPGTGGVITGDSSPGGVTLAVKLLTGIMGRRNRGRQFWPGIAEVHTDGNLATSTFMNNLSQIFTRHLLGWSVNGIDFLPAVVSRTYLLIRVLTGFSMDQFIDSQRRRLSNRGR